MGFCLLAAFMDYAWAQYPGAIRMKTSFYPDMPTSLNRTLITTTALGMALVFSAACAACSGETDRQSSSNASQPGVHSTIPDTHAFSGNIALKKGNRVVTIYPSDDEPSHPFRRVLGTPMGEVSVTSIEDLRERIVPIDSIETALAYSELLRLFDIPESVVPGDTLTFDEGISGQGFFSTESANKWGVGRVPKARWQAGQMLIDRPVFCIQGKLIGLDSRTAVIVIQETIDAAGTYEWKLLRVVETGSTADDFLDAPG